MLLGFLALAALAPAYWLLPAGWRPGASMAIGLTGLYWLDPRALVLVLGAATVAFGFATLGPRLALAPRRAILVLALLALAALFVWNKLGAGGHAVLPSQAGLAVLGLSYLVLKIAALLVEAARTPGFSATFTEVLHWLCFLPIYPSGPIEEFDHFRHQQPRVTRARVLGGCERLLFGYSKLLLGSHYLGQWTAPLLADPASASRLELWLGAYAVAARFYLDFSGYSDLAIGVAALYGYEIEENFDWPFLRRNLTQFWQHWHMTLTRFLRTYLFVPVSRLLLRNRVPGPAAILAAQVVSMLFCGLWHGLGWGFVLWGLAQALGLAWVGLGAPRAARHLPPALVRWWRSSRAGYAASSFVTASFFAATAILVALDLRGALAYFAALAASR